MRTAFNSIVCALLAIAGTAAAASGAPVPLTGHVLPALEDGRASPVIGARSAAESAHTLTVVLRRTDETGFQAYLRDVYDPFSAIYRKFLSAQQIADRFGPSPAQLDEVTAFFRDAGFTIDEGSATRMTLAVTAPRATIERALSVGMLDYALGERRFFANDRDPELPATIAAHVQAVIGLANLAQPRPVASWLRKQPCKEQGDTNGYTIQNQAGDAYDACKKAVDACAPKQQLDAAEIADVMKVCTKFLPKPTSTALSTPTRRVAPAAAKPWKDASGAGQKVGIVGFDTFVRSDVADYLELFGLPDGTLDNLSQVHVNGGAPLGPDQREVLLDINTILAGAPEAKVVVYDAPFTGGGSFQALFDRAIGDGVTIISNSWTYCEDQTTAADVQSIDAILATAAGAGISVFNASGDTGSTCLDGSPNTIGVPAGSPNATAVGGTSLTTGPTAVYVSEAWWNGAASTPPTGQGGFGVSRFFTRPSYQSGFSASPMRSIPDIAFAADPAAGGIILCQASAGGCPNGLLYGGTSIAAPAIAAAVALLNNAVGQNLGNFNLAAYPLAGTLAFHSSASMGSDFAHVGLGSPNFNALYLGLTAQVPGAVSATQSKVSVTSLLVAADGTSSTAVVVRLRDVNGNAIAGKTVTLAATPGGSAVITPASAVTTTANGAAVFTVRNSQVETVELTATDTTDSLILAERPRVAFGVPMAAAGSIVAGPTSVKNDGIATTSIIVTLKDAQNRPTPGKLIVLSQGAGRSIVSGPQPATTDANGQVTFTATDRFEETVTYTAVDATDGNLPVPGSASVTFSGQGSSSCVTLNPAAAPGYTLTPFSTGYNATTIFYGNVNWGCRGAQDPAFTTDGSALVSNFLDGSLYRLPPQGGSATSSNRLSTLGATLMKPVFGKDGRLYVSRGATNGDFNTGAIYEIDPVTGATLRTVMSGLTCPTALVVDPLSGDLFFDDSCFGAGADNPSLWRLRNPGSAAPTLTVYTTLPGTPTGWIAIAPDGTIFIPRIITAPAPLLRISGTNKPMPPTVETLTDVVTSYWVNVGEVLPSGAAKSLIVLSGSTIKLVDITTTPPAFTDLILQGPSSGTVGPDGCLYVSNLDTIYKLAPASGGCGFLVSNPAPALRLTPAAATANQGGLVTLTAQFDNLTVPVGTPVYFSIGAANPQTRLARTDAKGAARVTYPGLAVGTDAIDARASIGDVTYRSTTARVTWVAGKHTTFLSLAGSTLTGTAGKPLSLRASLADVSTPANTPVANVPVTIAAGSASCNVVTDAHGAAACTLTIAAPGQVDVVATFAGNAAYGAASARAGATVVAPATSVAALPASLDFGTVAVGTSTSARSVTLTNAGTSAFTLASIAVVGANPAEFSATGGANACVAGQALAANGGTCVLYVVFAPAATGLRTAQVTVSDGAAGVVGVPLQGTGSGGGGASVTANPQALAFGSLLVGSTSAPATSVLTNTGTAPFVVAAITLGGTAPGDFQLNAGLNACADGVTIAPNGGTCRLQATFRPTAAGPRAADVAVSDATGATVSLGLAGTGTLPPSNCFTGPLPAGGTGTACLTSSAPACALAAAAFLPATNVPVPPPANVQLPYGLFAFEARGCGAAVTLTFTYPAALPAQTRYYKFGATPADPTPHWYSLDAVVLDNTLTVTLVDGGAGDDDRAANGVIRDPGGAGYLQGPVSHEPIPTLDRTALALLALLLVAMAGRTLRRSRRRDL